MAFFFFGRGLHRLPIFLSPLRGWGKPLECPFSRFAPLRVGTTKQPWFVSDLLGFASEKSRRRISRINCQLNTASPFQSHCFIANRWFAVLCLCPVYWAMYGAKIVWIVECQAFMVSWMLRHFVWKFSDRSVGKSKTVSVGWDVRNREWRNLYWLFR